MVGRRQVVTFVIARAGGRMLHLLPAPLLRRAGLGGRDAAAVEPLADLVSPTATRVLIGPANSAGQATQWARALERELPATGVVSTAVIPAGRTFGFPVDQAVPLGVYRWSKRWASAQRATVESRFTHVLAESGRQLFGDAGGSALRELRHLQRGGIAVGLVFHGSDIRSPRRHAGSSAWSPFRTPSAAAATLELRARENRRLVRRLGAPVFVTTPDLLDDLPGAAWLPVVVDASPWATAVPAFSGARPVVVHAPSNGHLKGTALVEPVLEALDREGVIEYRRIIGVPSSEMPARYADADIVLDQVGIGSYGVSAVEAMHAGRLVIARIDTGVRDRIRRLTGRDLPIVHADPGTLEAVLRGIAADPDAARTLAERGPEYAAEIHDGRYSVRVLGALLG